MYDFLELRIPFDTDLRDNFVLDLKSLAGEDGIKLQAGSVTFDGTKYIVDELRHPYESLQSNYSGLAFKIYPLGFGKYDVPHILLRGSPAKIMQGHNVFGSTLFTPAFQEFLAILGSIYPDIYAQLNIPAAEIRALDCTYFARVESTFIAKQVITMLTRVSHRHIRSSREKFETTAYQNRNSTYYSLKTYLKEYELKKEIEELTKTVKNTFNQTEKKKLLNKLEILNAVYPFTKNMIRFEGRIFARKMEKHLIPTNAFEFSKYEKENPQINKDMWCLMFDALFETFKGQNMDTLDDDAIKFKIEDTFDSKRKQTNIYKFYLLIRSIGYERARDITERTTFWRLERDLISIGLSKLNLQNISSNGSNVVPLIKVVNIEFTDQVPHYYKEPVSQFLPLRAV